jgi:hypothetical protein
MSVAVCTEQDLSLNFVSQILARRFQRALPGEIIRTSQVIHVSILARRFQRALLYYLTRA